MFEHNDFIIPKASSMQSGIIKHIVTENQDQNFDDSNNNIFENIDFNFDNPEQYDPFSEYVTTNESIIEDIPNLEPKLEINEDKPKLEINENNKKLEDKHKYYIHDLFWLCNPKLESGEITESNEADYCIISYNISFTNLKITFYKVTDSTFSNSVVFRNQMKLLVTGAIYPSSCIRVLNSSSFYFTCIEQLINKTGEKWELERPKFVLKKDSGDEDIILYCFTNETNYYYIFKDWQKEALLTSMKFCINEGFLLAGKKTFL